MEHSFEISGQIRFPAKQENNVQITFANGIKYRVTQKIRHYPIFNTDHNFASTE